MCISYFNPPEAYNFIRNNFNKNSLKSKKKQFPSFSDKSKLSTFMKPPPTKRTGIIQQKTEYGKFYCDVIFRKRR